MILATSRPVRRSSRRRAPRGWRADSGSAARGCCVSVGPYAGRCPGSSDLQPTDCPQ